MKFIKLSFLVVFASFLFLISTFSADANFCTIDSMTQGTSNDQSIPCVNRTQATCTASPYLHLMKIMTCKWDSSGSTTPPPQPVIVMVTATPSSITSGGTSMIEWVALNATSCNSGGHGTGVEGDFNVTPTTTTSYPVTCTGPGGTATDTATVTVSTPTVSLTKPSDNIKNLVDNDNSWPIGTVTLSLTIQNLPSPVSLNDNHCRLKNITTGQNIGTYYLNTTGTDVTVSSLTNSSNDFRILCYANSLESVVTSSSQIQNVLTQSGTLSSSATSGGVTNCIIPVNGSTCTIPASWTTTNPKTGINNTFQGGGIPSSYSPNSPVGATVQFSGSGILPDGGSSTVIPLLSQNKVDGENNTTSNPQTQTNDLATLSVTVQCIQTPVPTTWNASTSKCEAPKPDLIANTPTVSGTGMTRSFSSLIKNQSTQVGTGSSFHNFFQGTNTDPNGDPTGGGGAVAFISNPLKFSLNSLSSFFSSLIPKASAYTATFFEFGDAQMNALGVGGSNTATQSYTFGSNGIYWVRACADKSTINNPGTIGESIESNNCSDWVKVIIGSGAINGQCSSPAEHYYCSIGTSINQNVGASAWTWQCQGVNGGTTASCTENFYKITATQGANCSIVPAGITNVPSGGSQTYNISANIGYNVSSLIVDGLTLPPQATYTFSNVTANHTITASCSSSISTPTVTTKDPVTDITGATALGGGTIVSNGGSTVTTSGIVWGKNINPTISLSTKTTNGPATGSWTHTMTGLEASTKYYYRAYATNTAGTSYGANVEFTTGTGGGATAGVINATDCEIKVGESNCNTVITWATQNPITGLTSQVTTVLNPNPIATANTNSSGLSYQIPYGTHVFYLYHNYVELDSDWGSATCVAGTIWDKDQSMCVLATTDLPDLTAIPLSWPTTATVGISTNFDVTILNEGVVPTGGAFFNILKTSTSPDGSTDLTPYQAAPYPLGELSELSMNYVSRSHVFNNPGTYYVSACADFNTDMYGNISESNENNNCTGWGQVEVIDNPNAYGALTATDCEIDLGQGSCATSLNWNVENPIGTSAVTSDTPDPDTTVYSGNSGVNQSADVPYPSRNFFLYNNFTELGTATAYATCVEGTSWNFPTLSCEKPIDARAQCHPTVPLQCLIGTPYTIAEDDKFYIWDCINPPYTSDSCMMPKDEEIDPPGANVSLVATPSRIFKGRSSTLTWTSGDGYTCQSPQFETGGLLSGSVSVSPLVTTVYELTCTKEGEELSGSAKVRVINPFFFES